MKNKFEKLVRSCIVTIAALVAWDVQAHGPNDPPHQLYQITDLQLESDEALKGFAISYVTHSRPTAEYSAAECHQQPTFLSLLGE